MVVQAGKAALLLRYSDYRNTEFIQEHNKIVSKQGYVWLLKAGRRLVENKLAKVKKESSLIILKAPKGKGGDYYYAEILDYRYGRQINEGESPEYYKNLPGDEKLWQIESLDGTWIKIGQINPICKELMDKFVLLSNEKSVVDVINSTMSAVLYIWCKEEMTL